MLVTITPKICRLIKDQMGQLTVCFPKKAQFGFFLFAEKKYIFVFCVGFNSTSNFAKLLMSWSSCLMRSNSKAKAMPLDTRV